MPRFPSSVFCLALCAFAQVPPARADTGPWFYERSPFYGYRFYPIGIER